MSDTISSLDQITLSAIARLGGLRAEHARKFPKLQTISTTEAATKRLERLCDKGMLAASPLPRGQKLYRLSQKGVRVTNAPKAFANQPTKARLAELISISSVGWNLEAMLFLMPQELQSLAEALSPGSLPTATQGRFLLRKVQTINSPNASAEETLLYYWFAEIRTPDQIVKRIEIIVQKLAQQRLFSELIELDLFKVAVAVPTASAKAAVEAKKFRVGVEVVVIEELQDILA